jgi:hypothetical protein
MLTLVTVALAMFSYNNLFGNDNEIFADAGGEAVFDSPIVDDSLSPPSAPMWSYTKVTDTRDGVTRHYAKVVSRVPIIGWQGTLPGYSKPENRAAEAVEGGTSYMHSPGGEDGGIFTPSGTVAAVNFAESQMSWAGASLDGETPWTTYLLPFDAEPPDSIAFTGVTIAVKGGADITNEAFVLTAE